MNLSRPWSAFLVGFAAWTWTIWPTFLRNIARDPRSFAGGRPRRFFVVHLVLSVVSLVFGTAIGLLGAKGLAAEPRRGRRDRTAA
jgi:hypothetical protein